jgi:outer membrane protein assembly factor BamD
MIFPRYLVLVFLCFAITVGCASKQVQESSSAELAFNEAQELQKDERFEEALAKYSEVKNKHPYSKFAAEAELCIADIHFAREAFIESAQAYQLFKEFHPKHAKIEYVTYQLGLSYYNQLPSTIDRDLQISEQAMISFNEIINSYPNSELHTKAMEKRTDLLKKLAEKELYIADFYFVRKFYDSALGRYERMLKKYPGLGLDERALYGAFYSAMKLGQKEKADKLFSELKENFPKSNETSKAQKEWQHGIH